MEIQHFRFRYALFTIDARLDAERLVARTGVRTIAAPIPALQHLWVGGARFQDHSELVLSYRTRKGGLKRVRLFADKGAPGFDALVAALLALRPEIDIRGLPPAAAYQRMGSRNLEWVALPLLMAGGLALLVGLLMPMLIHGADPPAVERPVEALAEGAPLPTRNLTLVGAPQLQFAAHGEAPAGRAGPARLWVPLVGPGWTPTTPVSVVMEVALKPDQDPVVRLAGDRYTGVVRDVLWEGVAPSTRRDLVAAGVILAPQVRLFEEGADARSELVVACTLVGLLVCIVAITAVVLRGRRSRSP